MNNGSNGQIASLKPRARAVFNTCRDLSIGGEGDSSPLVVEEKQGRQAGRAPRRGPCTLELLGLPNSFYTTSNVLAYLVTWYLCSV